MTQGLASNPKKHLDNSWLYIYIYTYFHLRMTSSFFLSHEFLFNLPSGELTFCYGKSPCY